MGGNKEQNPGNQQGFGNQQGSMNQPTEQKQDGGGFLGGLGDKFNSAAGGGRESEKNEDYLDKGVLSMRGENAFPVMTCGPPFPSGCWRPQCVEYFGTHFALLCLFVALFSER